MLYQVLDYILTGLKTSTIDGCFEEWTLNIQLEFAAEDVLNNERELNLLLFFN